MNEKASDSLARASQSHIQALQINSGEEECTDPVPAFLAFGDPEAFWAMEPSKKKHLGWWLIWAVCHLVDFTNL